ncbi:MAG: SEL1-like repeat protein [Magnetococcales bacterium]|nr:SEL1-like repeat protein [Magnetococcales bacterium]
MTQPNEIGILMATRPRLRTHGLTLLAAAALMVPALTLHAGPLEDALFERQLGYPKAAYEMLAPLAQKGTNAEAQFQLGDMLQRGEGTTRNRYQAAKWFKSAAASGHKKAMHALARLYRDGDGVKRRRSLAYLWLHLAAPEGIEDRLALEATLSATERKQGKALLKRYKGNPKGAAAQADRQLGKPKRVVKTVTKPALKRKPTVKKLEKPPAKPPMVVKKPVKPPMAMKSKAIPRKPLQAMPKPIFPEPRLSKGVLPGEEPLLEIPPPLEDDPILSERPSMTTAPLAQPVKLAKSEPAPMSPVMPKITSKPATKTPVMPKTISKPATKTPLVPKMLHKPSSTSPVRTEPAVRPRLQVAVIPKPPAPKWMVAKRKALKHPKPDPLADLYPGQLVIVPPKQAPKPAAHITKSKPSSKSPRRRETSLRNKPPQDYGVYAVQVDACRERTSAEASVANLRQKGYNPFILKIKNKRQDQTWYTVQIGRFDKRSDADAAALAFQRKENREAMAFSIRRFASKKWWQERRLTP